MSDVAKTPLVGGSFSKGISGVAKIERSTFDHVSKRFCGYVTNALLLGVFGAWSSRFCVSTLMLEVIIMKECDGLNQYGRGG
ncbi:hypothetical protein RA27_07930 [Ruegeria sp. ANG-R]|uniref:hypothetical protein n=1 Tax=Ruegeria sp. ANG-R TaxID=1577903 RepID=UPI00057D99B0|nr:hypothetical protein [Ruegeria sp. ANG-R]KIC43220.1 hypothetical protein RA27_07930 [Ruegeria sp. ANG-R]